MKNKLKKLLIAGFIIILFYSVIRPLLPIILLVVVAKLLINYVF